jgi:hypothetical protein
MIDTQQQYIKLNIPGEISIIVVQAHSGYITQWPSSLAKGYDSGPPSLQNRNPWLAKMRNDIM